MVASGSDNTVRLFTSGPLVAFHTATHQIVGVNALSRLTTHEWFERLIAVHTLIVPPTYELNGADYHEIVDAQGRFRIIGEGMLDLQLADMPAQAVAAVPRHLERHREFIFYQFAFDARTKRREGDTVSALLFATVALEGAHAVVLKLGLDRSMKLAVQSDDERAKVVAEKAETLLIKMGLSEMIGLTFLSFVPHEDRATEDEITACKNALSLRNAIMHALTSKRGEYKLRNRTPGDLENAISAINVVYNRLLKILEREL